MVLTQGETDIRCVAFVAAMATQSTVEEFEDFFHANPISARKTPPYEDIHFYRYALSRGYFCGLRMVPGAMPNIATSEIELEAKIKISDFPAYVVVESLDKSWGHAVYWDGQNIIDPAPHSKNPRHPSEYKIKSWTPVYRPE